MLNMLKEIRIALSLLSLFVILGLVIGCGNSNPITTTTVGELKSASNASQGQGQAVKILDGYKVAEIVPTAPKLLIDKKKEEEEIMTLSHSDDPGGDETFLLVMKEGYYILEGCDVNVLVNGSKDLGSATAPENLSEVPLQVEDRFLPSGKVTLTVRIICDGEVRVTGEITIDRPAASPHFLFIGDDDEEKNKDDEDDEEEEEEETLRADDAYLGDSRKEVVVEFEDWINATSSSKDNVTIEDEDGVDYRIISYDENGCLVTFVLRKDLPAGEITISYNGRGGLKGRPGGEKVEKFEFEFTVEEEEALTIREAIAAQASTTVAKGLYRAGTTFLIALNEFRYEVSRFSRQVLSNPAFPVEREEGETEIVFISSTDLGLQPGKYTGSDVISAVTAAGYSLLPPETAPQSRLLYPNQPNNQVVLFVSTPVPNPTDGKNYLFFLGREDNKALGQWLTAIPVTGAINYSLLAVGRRR